MKLICSTFSSVTLVCLEEAFLMKFSLLSFFFNVISQKKCAILFHESSIVHTLVQFDCTYVKFSNSGMPSFSHNKIPNSVENSISVPL